MKQSARNLRLGQFVASEARRRLISISWLALVWVPLPSFRLGRVTTPTSLTRGFDAYAGVLGAGRHGGRLAADDPEESEEGYYANSDRQKINVFSIHKPKRTGRRR